MSDLTFSSYLQGPLGEAIQATDTMGALPPPVFAPAVTLTSSVADPVAVNGPAMRLLGPGDVCGLAGGTVVRSDPPAGAVDVEPNYMAVAEVVPPELPWVLTPARAGNGRLRPWFVLVVVDEATAPLVPGEPLPSIEADIAQLPDLRDSWGWAHVQRTTGTDTLPGGGQASAAVVARLVCPRRLSAGATYRACVVPAFASGVAAGLGDPRAGDVPHDLAWNVDAQGTVRLPVYHHWTFTTGEAGDFEKLVTRLRPADPELLRVSSVRPVDVRAPWPGDTPLAPDAQLVGVQGALVPFDAPPVPEPAVSAGVLAAFDERIRAHLDAPAHRLRASAAGDTVGALAPPLYGGRHVSQDLVDGDPHWLGQLNVAIANRIAAGLGANYVRANQEDLMAKAWEQVGAIREANRLRAVVELTTVVAEKVHDRHVSALLPGEVLALAAPANARTMTSPATTLAMETRMSRMTDGAATSAFARRVRPGGILARRTGVTVRELIPRALAGAVTVPAAATVIPASPTVVEGGLSDVSSTAAASQLVALNAFARVAALNDAGPAADVLTSRFDSLQLDGDLMSAIGVGSASTVAAAIAGDVGSVTEFTSLVLSDMSTDGQAFGAATAFGVPIVDADIAGRVIAALHPGDRHLARLATQTSLPPHVSVAGPSDPVMACPAFPVPTALALLQVDPEWFMPGLGAVPPNKVALLKPNNAFIESYLVGMNHEMMAELLWREYPTDRRGTPFRRFWPRPDGGDDIPAINAWLDPATLGAHTTLGEGLSVLLVRGDVVRRYPDMVVTAARSGLPDAAGSHRPDPAVPALPPLFMIRIDAATVAYAFPISNGELMTPASAAAPGWFFVFAEHGFRIRFGFDDPPDTGELVRFARWDDARWPAADGSMHPAFVPVVRGHAIAGAAFAPPPVGPEAPTWNRDAADIARITLQHPFRVAIQADILLHPEAP